MHYLLQYILIFKINSPPPLNSVSQVGYEKPIVFSDVVGGRHDSAGGGAWYDLR